MGPRAKITYKKYGPSKRCRGGKGGPWANNVYIIVVKGKFQDCVGISLSTLYGFPRLTFNSEFKVRHLRTYQ